MHKLLRRLCYLLLIAITGTLITVGILAIDKKEFDLTFKLKANNDAYNLLDNELMHMKGYLVEFPLRKYYIKGTAVIKDTEFKLYNYSLCASQPEFDLYCVEMDAYLGITDHISHIVNAGGFIFILVSITGDSFESMWVSITGLPDYESGDTATYQAFLQE